MSQVFVVSCNGPECAQEIRLDGISRAGPARFEARMRGWSGPADSQWFCPEHRALAWRLQDGGAGAHEDWCPRLTRQGACCCRRDLPLPAPGGSADERLAIEDWKRPIHRVRPAGQWSEAL